MGRGVTGSMLLLAVLVLHIHNVWFANRCQPSVSEGKVATNTCGKIITCQKKIRKKKASACWRCWPFCQSMSAFLTIGMLLLVKGSTVG
ncbi:hypothetical protein QBC44DRAFT_5029 [Cladorrhinum sp. PSN332]|nr:hypothetical protein QBC44DRAFT_5029 [Cladorrhinum sp. PSN332]